jgi:hypothetical protein
MVFTWMKGVGASGPSLGSSLADFLLRSVILLLGINCSLIREGGFEEDLPLPIWRSPQLCRGMIAFGEFLTEGFVALYGFQGLVLVLEFMALKKVFKEAALAVFKNLDQSGAQKLVKDIIKVQSGELVQFFQVIGYIGFGSKSKESHRRKSRPPGARAKAG